MVSRTLTSIGRIPGELAKPSQAEACSALKRPFLVLASAAVLGAGLMGTPVPTPQASAAGSARVSDPSPIPQLPSKADLSAFLALAFYGSAMAGLGLGAVSAATAPGPTRRERWKENNPETD